MSYRLEFLGKRETPLLKKSEFLGMSGQHATPSYHLF